MEDAVAKTVNRIERDGSAMGKPVELRFFERRKEIFEQAIAQPNIIHLDRYI
jgi:hypothetical protein